MTGLALTFDDGPDPAWTSRLLDRLAELDAQATFFPIATRAAAHPELIARMLREGHSVGLHCHEHVRHSDRDAAWLGRDTRQALDLLASVGVTPRLWRTPWGDTAAWTASLAAEHNLEVIGWSVDTHDWRGDRAADMFAATRSGLVPGAVVLAHDGIGPGARREDVAETLAYADLVGRHAQAHAMDLQALEPAWLPATSPAPTPLGAPA